MKYIKISDTLIVNILIVLRRLNLKSSHILCSQNVFINSFVSGIEVPIKPSIITVFDEEHFDVF